MNPVDRFLLAVYMIVLIFAYSVFLFVPFGYPTLLQSAGFVYNVFERYQWYIFIGAILMIILNVKLLVDLFKGERTKNFGIIKYTSEGEVNISNDAIRSMVIKVATEVRGIKDLKVMIKPEKDKVNILVRTYIMPDINIPSTVKEIQENVKKYIEAMAEIPIGEVKVTIADIASSTQLRVK
jgi:uncharacterized alkaline shock family protein YloU